MSAELKTAHGVCFVSSSLLEQAGGVAHGFSTRQGGVSAPPFDTMDLGYNRGDAPDCVRENYRRFCTAIGADHTRVVKTRQVHGDTVRAVTAADAGLDPCTPAPYEADGLVTDVPGLCLSVFSADCVPVLLYDPVRRCIAAVHSGWRGTAMAIAPKAAAIMMEDYGCRAEHILAAIGPAISTCCFETHADVPRAMIDAFGAAAEPFIQRAGDDKFRVDLKGIIARGLRGAGLAPEHIDISDHCTACRPALYWSHRLTGNARGSMAAMIQLTGV